MISEYRYSLEKGSKKNNCPNCNKKTFVRYVDTKTTEFLPYQYGRCDRESKCNYHLSPYLDGYSKVIKEQEKDYNLKLLNLSKSNTKNQIVYFDLETFNKTLEKERYEKNTFIQNLLHNVQFPFDVDEVRKVILLYRLGTITSGYRANSITFPFIDINQNINAVQVKQFDKDNHTIGTDFLHSIIEKYYNKIKKPLPVWLKSYIEQDKRINCLFGEHILRKYPNNPIALVEAPKTAIYGTLYFGLPNKSTDLIWLAVYNKSSLSFDKIKVLQGRKILVFPDLSKDGSTFKEWENKTKDFEKNLSSTKFIFSDLLEKIAPDNDRIKGNDLADYLIKLDWRKFRNTTPQVITKKAELLPRVECLPTFEVTKPKLIEKPLDLSNDITELENYFVSIEKPNYPIRLNNSGLIIDCSKFINSHLATIKANPNNVRFLPYLNRLNELKQVLSNNTKLPITRF